MIKSIKRDKYKGDSYITIASSALTYEALELII